MAYRGNPMGSFQIGYSIGSQPGMNPLGDAIRGVLQRYKEVQAQKERMGYEVGLQRAKTMAGFDIAKSFLEKEGGDYETSFKIGGISLKKSKKGKPTKWDIQKEARQTVNAIINQNPSLQMQAFENPTLITDLIDQEVGRLSQQYELEKETTPSTTEKIKVRLKVDTNRGKTGDIGLISPQYFDPNIYEKIE